MNLLTAPVLILSGILAIEAIFAGQYHIGQELKVVVGQEVHILNQTAISIREPAREPAETPFPEPSYTPVMRSYNITKDHDLWHPEDPGSYITPDNGWVRYYASQLYIDYDGRIRYRNRPIPLLTDIKGNILSWTDQPFLNKYISDNEQFNFPPNQDVWVMPDYYLTHGMQDDCDGWMVTVTNLMLSGELSVRENGTFVKKVVQAKAVLGYMNGYRDGWTEYKAYGKTFLTSTALVNTGIDGSEKRSSTEFVEKKDERNARPVFEFTNKSFGEYRIW